MDVDELVEIIGHRVRAAIDLTLPTDDTVESIVAITVADMLRRMDNGHLPERDPHGR